MVLHCSSHYARVTWDDNLSKALFQQGVHSIKLVHNLVTDFSHACKIATSYSYMKLGKVCSQHIHNVHIHPLLLVMHTARGWGVYLVYIGP